MFEIVHSAILLEALLPPRRIEEPLQFAMQEIELPFVPLSRAEILLRKESKDEFEQRRSQALLQEFEKQGRIRESYPYPVQVLQFGRDLTMITLGVEVVIDYALRLKEEFKSTPIWVAAYSNDVMAYIPSERVLAEGGYEGGGAMRFSNPQSVCEKGDRRQEKEIPIPLKLQMRH